PLANLHASPAGSQKILSALPLPRGSGSLHPFRSQYPPAPSISPVLPETLPATACTALSLLPGISFAAASSTPPLSETPRSCLPSSPLLPAAHPLVNSASLSHSASPASTSTALPAPLFPTTLAATPHNPHTESPTPPTAIPSPPDRLHTAPPLPSPSLPSTTRRSLYGASSPSIHVPLPPSPSTSRESVSPSPIQIPFAPPPPPPSSTPLLSPHSPAHANPSSQIPLPTLLLSSVPLALPPAHSASAIPRASSPPPLPSSPALLHPTALSSASRSVCCRQCSPDPAGQGTTTAAARRTTATPLFAPLARSAPSSLFLLPLPSLPTLWQTPSSATPQINSAAPPPLPLLPAPATQPVSPATNALPTQKNRPLSRLALLPTPCPRSPPATLLLPLAASRIPCSPSLAQAPVSSVGPPSRSPSAAYAPVPQTPPAPCTPAIAPANISATPRSPPSSLPVPPHTPPASSLPA